MKKILILIWIFLMNLQPLAFAEINSVSLQVKGLSCPFCALGLEKQLKKVPTVEKVDVHLKKGRADLTLKSDQSIDLKTIQAAVNESGFTLENIFVEITGLVKENQSGMLTLISTGDNREFLLFDKSHKGIDAQEFLEPALKKQLLSARENKKTVVLNGVIHEHANLPFGLMVEQIKIEE